MEDEPQQDALFYLECRDEDGCVWICSADLPGPRARREGRRGGVAVAGVDR